MHASEVTAETTRVANELYWSSDRSVNQIADELDLSKGALYGVIAPLPSGLYCPLCADEVAYPNRTAKDRDLLRCPTCEWEGGAAETVEYDGAGETDRDLPLPGEGAGPGARAAEPTGATPSSQGSEPAGSPRTPAPRGRAADATETDDDDLPTPLLTPRARTVVGGALIGAAVGLALVILARRR